jgi:hypothetical protein
MSNDKPPHDPKPPITHIEGIDPADIWAAHFDAEAGLLTDHEELFARLPRPTEPGSPNSHHLSLAS